MNGIDAILAAIESLLPRSEGLQPGMVLSTFVRFMTYDIHGCIGLPFARHSDSLHKLSISCRYWYLAWQAAKNRVWEKDPEAWSKYYGIVHELGWLFAAEYERYTSKAKPCVTFSGLLCWVPSRTQQDDRVCVFFGGRIPFVARSRYNDTWEYIGPAFVLGLMNGEAWDLPSNKWWFMRIT